MCLLFLWAASWEKPKSSAHFPVGQLFFFYTAYSFFLYCEYASDVLKISSPTWMFFDSLKIVF